MKLRQSSILRLSSLVMTTNEHVILCQSDNENEPHSLWREFFLSQQLFYFYQNSKQKVNTLKVLKCHYDQILDTHFFTFSNTKGLF